jgi:hypothetical protein
MLPAMNADFSDLEDLVRADNPLEWAWEHLVPAGAGEHASIFAHPSRTDLVVRVSDYPDGWFGYADLLFDAREEDVSGLEHAPVAHAIAIRDGFHLAVCDRLDDVGSEDVEALGWVAAAKAILGGGVADPAAVAAFEAAQPGFRAFADRIPGSFRDLRDGNFMLRGRTLVLNDPSGSMSSAMAQRLAGKWAPEITPFAPG